MEGLSIQNTRDIGAVGIFKHAIWGYAAVVVLMVAWLWRAKFLGFGRYPAEAIGYDIVSVGLPILLLLFGARKLCRELKARGFRSPLTLTFGTIWASISLRAFSDLFFVADPHKRAGLMQTTIFYAFLAAIHFTMAYRKRAALTK